MISKNDHAEDLAGTTPPRPRRLLALLYETLPVFAVLFFATALLLPFLPGDHVPVGSHWYRIYLLLAPYPYFVLAWLRGGQTLAMRPWRLAVVSMEGRLTLGRASLRYAVALLGWLPLGLGHLWFLFDAQGRNWHDMASGTRIVLRPK